MLFSSKVKLSTQRENIIFHSRLIENVCLYKASEWRLIVKQSTVCAKHYACVYSNSFNWIALLKILICGRLLSSRKKCFKCNVAKNLLAAIRGGGGDGGRTYGFWRLLHQRIRQIEKKKLSRTCSLEKFTQRCRRDCMY
jgi:hypothetical protein